MSENILFLLAHKSFGFMPCLTLHFKILCTNIALNIPLICSKVELWEKCYRKVKGNKHKMHPVADPKQDIALGKCHFIGNRGQTMGG